MGFISDSEIEELIKNSDNNYIGSSLLVKQENIFYIFLLSGLFYYVEDKEFEISIFFDKELKRINKSNFLLLQDKFPNKSEFTEKMKNLVMQNEYKEEPNIRKNLF